MHAFALDQAKVGNGHFRKLWSVKSKVPITSTPVVNRAETIVYVTNEEGGTLKALKVTDKSVLWEFGPSEVTAALKLESNNPDQQEVGAHTIASGAILSPSGRSIYFVGYGTFLLCLDAITGSLNWISAQHG
jgi:outer membrane protein assembly factor BamB